MAAVMSTADSQLLVTASAVTNDLYKPLFRKNAKDKELMWVSRGSVLLIAVIAYLIALNPNSSVMDLVSYAWAGFGAAFGPVILLSLIHISANRGANTVAVFSVEENGGISIKQQADCGGDYPWHIDLSEDETMLLAANKQSGNVSVISRNAEDGSLGGCLLQIPFGAPSFVKDVTHAFCG